MKRISITPLLLPLALATTLACTRATDESKIHLGILPAPTPSPLWLGAITPTGQTSIHGAAAVTLGASQKSSHVMVSISGAAPDRTYPWSLRTGHCNETGTIVSAANFPPLTTLPDGSATAELMISGALAPSQSYAVTVSEVHNNTSTVVACSTLTLSRM